MSYASRTQVPEDRSRREIQRIIGKYKATGFAYAEEKERAMIGFQTEDRRVRFLLPLTPPVQMTTTQVAQFRRSRWRALLLAINAKLESVEAGIESFDEAFMSHIVMPDGKTIAEHALPAIARAYSSGEMLPLLDFKDAP